MIYKGMKDNEMVKKEIYKIMVMNDTNFKKVAEKLGMSQPQMSQKFGRRFLLLKDLVLIADALGYDVDIKFKKR